MKKSEIIQKCIDEKWIPIRDLKILDKGLCFLCDYFFYKGMRCSECPINVYGISCLQDNSVYADFSFVEIFPSNIKDEFMEVIIEDTPNSDIKKYKEAAQNMINELRRIKTVCLKKGE
jgi:hypothetical protein